MATRTFKGGAPLSALTGSGIIGTPADFTAVGAGYPTTGPFVVTIGKNTASEEKILVSSRSSNTFTIQTRGYDDTTSQDHAVGSTVEHTIDAVILTALVGHLDNASANPHPEYLLDTDLTLHEAAGNPHPIYLTEAEADALYQDLGHGHTAQEHPHTWIIGSEIKVPSGDVDYIGGFFAAVPFGQNVSLIRARHRINSGTSVTVKLQKNGVDIPDWTGISVTTTTTTTDEDDAAIADGDYIALVVTGVSGTPKNMSFSIFLEYSRA